MPRIPILLTAVVRCAAAAVASTVGSSLALGAEPVPSTWSASVGALSVRQEPDEATGLEERTRVFSTAALDGSTGVELGLSEIRASLDARGGTAGLKGDRYGDATIGLDGTWVGALSRASAGVRAGRAIEESDGMSLALGDQLGLVSIPAEERALSKRASGALSFERAWTARFATRLSAQAAWFEREVVSRQQSYEVAFDRVVDATWRVGLAYAGSVFRYGEDADPSRYTGPDLMSRHEVGPVTVIEARAGVRTSREDPGARTESGRLTWRHAPPERTLELLAARTIAQRPAGAGADLDDVVRGAWSENLAGATTFRASATDEVAKPLDDEDAADRHTLRAELGLTFGFGPAVVARPTRSRWELGFSATHEEANSAGARAERETLQTSFAATF